MPGHYTNTSTIIPAADVLAAAVQSNFDNLDDAVFAISGGLTGSGATSFRNMLLNSGFEVWENGVNFAPKSWTSGGGGTTARESTIKKHGVYSCALTKTSTARRISQIFYNDMNGTTYLRGRTVTFGAWVYATVASNTRISLFDGVSQSNSSYHTGSSAWEWLTCTLTIGVGITTATAFMEIVTTNTTSYLDSAIVVDSGVVYGYTPSSPTFSLMPTRATLWHDECTITAGTGNTFVVVTTMPYNGYYTQTTPAINNAWTHSCWLAAGTYTFSVLGRTNTSCGQIDWYIDGVNVISLQDWYSASAVAGVVKTATVTINGDGYHIIQGIVSAKNGSSTNYAATLTKYWFKQSSD